MLQTSSKATIRDHLKTKNIDKLESRLEKDDYHNLVTHKLSNAKTLFKVTNEAFINDFIFL